MTEKPHSIFRILRPSIARGENGDETYYTNPDRTILALEAMAAGTVSNIGFAKDMQRVIQQAVKKVNPRAYHPQMLIEYGGPFKNKIDEYDTILSDVRSTLIFGIAGIVALLTFYFRQPLAAFFCGCSAGDGLDLGVCDYVLGYRQFEYHDGFPICDFVWAGDRFWHSHVCAISRSSHG